MYKYIILVCSFIFFNVQADSSRLNQAAIASAHPLATQAGLDILNQGGNAFDAAITVSSVLAVVEPYGSGLGGGGFYLLHQSEAKPSEKNIVIDAREKAPLKATKSMYLSAQGRVLDKKSKEGPLAAAIPGVPAAMVYLAEHYGQLPLSKTLQPAIQLAKEGFEVNEGYIKAISYRHKLFASYPSSAAIYLDNGKIPKPGFKVVQTDLAKVLEALAKDGHDGFYQGEVATQLVNGVQANGGIWTIEDLKNYKVQLRKPLEGTYHGWRIITTPPPSAGGLAVLTALNILKRYEEDPLSESDRVHLIAESLRRAYCDRVKYMSDPDFNHVPISTLLSESHTDLITKKLSLNKATPSSSLLCGVPSREGSQTTHFSIMDRDGNRVGATLSINQYFGSGFVVPNTGVLLNNEMDDFSVSVGAENLYGLVGHPSNEIAPGKRPVSSMMPTFIESPKGIAILGTPGGSRIPTMLLLSILEADVQDSPLAWVGLARFHHQYLPDVISYEPEALSVPVQNALRLRGHRLEPTTGEYGNMQVVYWDQKLRSMQAVSDPRGYGHGKVITYEPESMPEE